MYQNRHGRFTAPDPLLASASLDNPQTFNRYVYVGNNPVNLTDPSGLTWCVNASGSVEWQGRQGSQCSGGFSDLDGKAALVKSGSRNATNGVAGEGDVVRFNAEGTLTILDPANRADVADYARATGAEVQAQSEQIAMPNSSIISTTVQGRPTADYLPPIASPDPPVSEETLDNIEILLGGLGQIPVAGEIADVASVAVSVGRGDHTGAGLGVLSVIPFIGNVAGAAKIARKLQKLQTILGEVTTLVFFVSKVEQTVSLFCRLICSAARTDAPVCSTWRA